jgi:hypothetical protein
MGSAQVMFDLTPDDEQDVVEAAFRVPADVENSNLAVATVLVTGLRPGATYAVETEGSASQVIAANEAGMITLTGLRPGVVRLAVE